jgi:hypothetical protein
MPKKMTSSERLDRIEKLLGIIAENQAEHETQMLLMQNGINTLLEQQALLGSIAISHDRRIKKLERG